MWEAFWRNYTRNKLTPKLSTWMKSTKSQEKHVFLIRLWILPLTDWLRWMAVFAAQSVEGWWGVSGNTDPIDLSQWAQCLLTCSSPVSLVFTWHRLSVGAQREHTHAWSPYVSGECSHSFHSECNLYLCQILLPPKQEIGLLFVSLASVIPYYSFI